MTSLNDETGASAPPNGRHETEAREALRLLRELRLNQRGTVGSPRPVMEYWLTDGRAPQGFTQGLRPLPGGEAAELEVLVEAARARGAAEATARHLVENYGSEAAAILNYVDQGTGLPLPSYDLWEERWGVHAFTVAAVIGGLRAAGRLSTEFGESERAAHALAPLADHPLAGDSPSCLFQLAEETQP